MCVVVVGAGAMGSIYTGILHDAGNDVSFVEANPTTVAAVNGSGAIINGPDGKETAYPIRAAARPEVGTGAADIVIFSGQGTCH